MCVVVVVVGRGVGRLVLGESVLFPWMSGSGDRVRLVDWPQAVLSLIRAGEQ